MIGQFSDSRKNALHGHPRRRYHGLRYSRSGLAVAGISNASLEIKACPSTLKCVIRVPLCTVLDLIWQCELAERFAAAELVKVSTKVWTT